MAKEKVPFRCGRPSKFDTGPERKRHQKVETLGPKWLAMEFQGSGQGLAKWMSNNCGSDCFYNVFSIFLRRSTKNTMLL